MLKTRRDTAIYDLLEEQASVATRTAKAFLAMTEDFGNLKHHAEIMDKLAIVRGNATISCCRYEWQ